VRAVLRRVAARDARWHPWREAKRQLQPAASSQAPLFTYAAAYPVPADFIRMYELPESGRVRWELMNLQNIGRCVVTNDGGPLDAAYIFDLEDTTQMSPLLVKTIAAEIAVNLALPLTRDATLKAQCESDRQGYLAAARTASAQQGSPRQLDSDRLLRARW
jgi:hypothetical protein